MCGIAGILSIKGQPVSASEIQPMVDALAHRGPNGEGVYCDGEVGFGHRRLAIFDLSEAGRQPMFSPDKRYCISHNGEVYNWPEIRQELENGVWQSLTDTETILHAYMERGPHCLEMFNGMFATAIWDKENKELFLARDRVGIKPLYYGQYEGRIYFGSEMKALFAAGFPKEANYPLIYDFLRWGLIDHSTETFFKGITCLPPGRYMTIDGFGTTAVRQFWDLIDIVQNGTAIDLPEAVEEYKFLLENAIDLRLRSDVPVGVFLSGGVDSSILAARLTSNAKAAEKMEAYTYEFDTGQAGEGAFASEVAAWLGLRHKITTLRYREVPDYFCKVLKHEEMPVTSLRVPAAHKLYEESAATGSTVVLEGHGGDHVGAGFEYYFMAHIMDVIMREGTRPAYEIMLSYMDSYNIPEEERLKKLFYVVGAISRVGSSTQDGIPFVKLDCLDEDFVENHVPRRINFPHPFDSYLLNAQYIDLFYHNMPRVLRYGDRGSMAVGREARVPILDHRIVELGFRSTERARVCENQQRYFMRKAAEGLLPKDILNRPKRSIVDPQRRWLQHELREWVTDIFSSKSFGDRGIFNQRAIVDEYEAYCKEEYPETGFHIFQYLNVELWFRVMNI